MEILILENAEISFTSFTHFFKKTIFSWYWSLFFFSVFAAIIVLNVQVSQNPLIFLRFSLGSILILFLPGFGLLKVLFKNKKLLSVEVIAISVGLSLALTPTICLFLNFTPYGITENTIVIGILIINTIFSLIGISKTYLTTDWACS